MKNKLTYLLLAAALFAGCSKEVTFKTTYVLKPLVQVESGDNIVPLTTVKAYAFDADTLYWGVASYADAEAGIITSKRNPAEKITSPIATAEPYVLEGTTGWLQMTLDKPWQMVLVVDTEHKIFCYTQQPLGENLGALYVSLVFRAWKPGYAYKDGDWSYYNEFYVPPTVLDFSLVPSSQAEEEGAETPIPQFKAYAYAVDTTAWYIASYKDAAAGIITSKTDPKVTRTNPSFPAYPEKSGAYVMAVSNPVLMVVAVDQTDKRYAYCHKDVDLEGEPVSIPLIFRLWKKEYLYVEDGWRVVDESLKPTEPTEPTDPEPENPDPENPDPETPATSKSR